MTIHTKWMELLRTEASDAFEYGKTPTTAVKGGFIDGQIKLMISPDPNQTWADFIRNKFVSVVQRHFVEFGCETVVLAFDDRRHVPKAKAITQMKRRAGVDIIPFTETDVLPNQLPSEQWKESIMSPWFKHRVIELVCANVPRLVSPPIGARLIIDWETITEYVYDVDAPEPADEGSSSIGEADLKFTHWMRRLQCPMLVEATDGDYIPISLGLRAAGFEDRVVLLKAWKPEKGGFEFIDVDTLHGCLRKAIGRSDAAPCWEVKLFIVLLGLSGTDFTRNLPLLSPQKMWAALPLLAGTFRMETPLLLHMGQGKRLVELLYAEVMLGFVLQPRGSLTEILQAFPKHIDPFSRSSVWSQAQASKLGARNKKLIPTDARIQCTLRNVNFLLSYWLDFRPPAPLEDYGFRVAPSGSIEWAD